MAKTGLKSTDRKLLYLVENALSRKGGVWTSLLRKEAEFDDFLSSFVVLATTLNLVIARKNILLSLKTEQSIVKYDSDYFCQTLGSKKHSATILDQLADAERLLNHRLEHPDGYDQVTLTRLEMRDVKNDLPIDGVRKLLASHMSRTSREIASRSEGHSPGQLEYLHLRRNLIRLMEELYKNMQRECLGLEPVEITGDAPEAEPAEV